MISPEQVIRPIFSEIDDQDQQVEIERDLDEAIRLAETSRVWPAVLRSRTNDSRWRWRPRNIAAVAERYEAAGWRVIRPADALCFILGMEFVLLVDFRK